MRHPPLRRARPLVLTFVVSLNHVTFQQWKAYVLFKGIFRSGQQRNLKYLTHNLGNNLKYNFLAVAFKIKLN